MKKYLISLIKFLFRPPSYRLKIFLLDVFGINLFRIFIYKLSYFLRGLLLKENLHKIKDKNIKKINDLEKNGITVYKNFFSAGEFNKISKAVKDIFSEINYEKFRDSGGLIKTLSLSDDEICSKKKYIYEKFLENEKISSLVMHNMRPLIFFPNRVVIQEIFFPKNSIDSEDVLHVCHSDRFFNHLKFFYYVNDQSEKNGAYMFARKSHKVSGWFRLLYEYESALRASKNKLLKFFGFRSDKFYVYEYDSLTPFFIKKLKIKLESINLKKNSLVVSNNSGFHSRGKMLSNSRRIQVRLQFQYLEIGIFRSLFLKVINKLNPRVQKILNDGV